MALVLTGCGFADVRSPVPEFMRAKEAEPPPPEAPPDVRLLVHDNLDAVFVANSLPHDVRVSAPHHEARGTGWTACVRAEVNSATASRSARKPGASPSATGRSSTAGGSIQTTIAKPRATSRSSSLFMVNRALILPFELHGCAHGFFQPFR
jgi:hypothetical protein